MTATSKNKGSSGGSDRVTHPGGKRGAYTAASPSGSDRGGINNSSVGARDRVPSRFDKFFHNISSSKRSHAPISNRENSSASLDHAISGGIGRTGTRSHTIALDSEVPELEEKIKSAVPNKRTRTSLRDVQVDARANTLSRMHAPNERDREIYSQLSNRVDGWEKPRMKKRSGIRSEVSVSKTSCPPLSERRAYTRSRSSVNAEIPEFQGGAALGPEELLVAATSAVNTGHACSSIFWKQMEAVFGFVSSEDIAFIKQQGNDLLTPPPGTVCEEDSSTLADGYLTENDDDNVPSLFQRLLSAIIVEEEVEGYSGRAEEDFDFDDMENGEFERDNSRGDMNVVEIPNYRLSLNCSKPEQAPTTSVACKQSQYNQMSINERLSLEVESIGICSEPLTQDEELIEDISRLQEKLNRQLSKKSQLMRKLEKSVVEAKELQEKDIERRAFEKLVGMAYEKYMNCYGPSASCSKGTRAGSAKKDALFFVKGVLDQCHKFENHNESCFTEPACMKVLQSVSSLVKTDISIAACNKEGEATVSENTKSETKTNVISEILGTTPTIPKEDSPSNQEPCEATTKKNDDLCLDTVTDTEATYFSNMQLPDDVGEQDKALGSWLNIDEGNLEDFDFNGLEIPMDDLSDLNITL